jgi:hypothetical protein
VSVTGQTATTPGVTSPDSQVTVRFKGRQYPAAPLARGAAYELFADEPDDGFLPNPGRAQWRFRRFAHVTDVTADSRLPSPDPPLWCR